MTALVSILNKRAAVIAADSAVTVDRGNNTTIFNTANKIFRLSNNNGVMIYGSSTYMGIPWEVLFKLYRDKGPGKSFKTLMEQVDDFIHFLQHEKHCCDETIQKDYLRDELSAYYRKVKEFTSNDYEETMKQPDSDTLDSKALTLKCLNDNFHFLDSKSEENGNCPELEKYTLKQLYAYAKDLFAELESVLKDDGLSETLLEWEKHFYHYIRSKLFIGPDSGIVFVGYGEDDILRNMKKQ